MSYYSMDYSLIDDLVDRLYSSKRNQWEEDLLVWLVILRTIPMDSLEVDIRYLRIFDEITNIISYYGHCSPCYELHLFMRMFDHSVYKKVSWIIPEPLFELDYPNTQNILGFYDHLLRNIEEFLLMEEDKQQSHDLFNYVVNFYFKKIQSRLQWFRPSLVDISDQNKEWLDNENDLKSVIKLITSLLYELEYVVDSLLSKQCPRFDSAQWLVKVAHRLPGKNIKEMVDRVIKELSYRRSPSMELGSNESIINYVVSTDCHQIIPIINNNDGDIGERLRQIFIDEKIVSTFDVCKWSMARLSDSPHLMELYENQFLEARGDGVEDPLSKIVKEYSVTLTPEEFRELLEELLPMRHKYFVIFEDVISELQFKLLKKLIEERSSISSSIILYTTREEELARKCHLNCEVMFYVPSKMYNIPDPTIDREVVGFVDEQRDMLRQLTKDDSTRCVISISGMPGSGKTTLAKLLFKHPSVTELFKNNRAFCTVSQVYKVRELLLQLVSQLAPDDKDIHEKQNIELAEKIHKSLSGRRYLVVLDDIWDIQAWDDLANCFPVNSKGSKIIITTRQTKLIPDNMQFVNLLSLEECWDLLGKELFQNQNCPEELTEVGKTIAKNCKGLPLSVILVAGLLKKLDRTKGTWQKIAETLTLGVDTDAEAHRKDIIELSYQNLPDFLKPCFLYFGIFPEDNKIPADKLILMWSAEGFVVGDDTKSAEDVAENYLSDLAGTSLITISEKNLSGRVKSYQVHDLIREFCITKSEEEGFFLKLSEYDKLLGYCSPIPSCPRGLVAINTKKKQFVEANLSALPFVRSMVFLPDKSETLLNNIYDFSFLYDYFKLLKILDLEVVLIGDSSLPLIFELVLLKYLAIQSDVYRIPGEISKLWNLETLIIRSSNAERDIQIPDSLWDMTKLRHVHISGTPDFDCDPKRVENTSTDLPKNLQTFSTPSLCAGGKLEKVLMRLQSIRKLKFRFSHQSLDVAENAHLFPMLEFLNNLESLKVIYSIEPNFKSTFYEFKFPAYLRKLALSNFCMPWKEISQLTKLKLLEVLKLQSNAFVGETWDMSEQSEAFEKLEVLKLEALDIVEWSGVGKEYFPKLRLLILCNLEKLEEIPEEIGDIDNIETIEVKWCSSSAAESAYDIQKAQKDFSKEIEILIH